MFTSSISSSPLIWTRLCIWFSQFSRAKYFLLIRAASCCQNLRNMRLRLTEKSNDLVKRFKFHVFCIPYDVEFHLRNSFSFLQLFNSKFNFKKNFVDLSLMQGNLALSSQDDSHIFFSSSLV